MYQTLSREFARPAGTPVLTPGRNCGCIALARGVAVLVDASDYYRNLERALLNASESILIIGWDFDGRIKLCPDKRDCCPLGPFLHELVERRSQLQVRILVWSGALVHAPGDPVPLLFGADWQRHPRSQ